MMWIAIGGLVVNLISMRLLSSASNESLNVKGAYLEVWSDMLGSLGVIIAALIIRFTGWSWIDTVVAVAIGVWVLPRTWQLMRESLGILMGKGFLAASTLRRSSRRFYVSTVSQTFMIVHVWAVSSGSQRNPTSHVVVRDAIDRRCCASRCNQCGKSCVPHSPLHIFKWRIRTSIRTLQFLHTSQPRKIKS